MKSRLILTLLLLIGIRCAHAPSSAAVTSLITRIDAGDESAARHAVGLLPKLSGGDLEDTMRAIGALAVNRPRVFLRVMTGKYVDAARIERIVTMLPLSSVDDDAERLRLVRARIDALSAISDAELGHPRDVAIAALHRYEQELTLPAAH